MRGGPGDGLRATVIVPVHNDPAGADACVRALLRQTLPAREFEIVAVDDGSTDDTLETLRRLADAHPERVVVVPGARRRGAYAARNEGIARARGKVLAFTDSDCEPANDWLEAGLEALRTSGADLAGGDVRFRFSRRRGPAEILDSITSLQVGRSIAEGGQACTANLFVRREVFDAIGPFPADVRSGGDFWWTREATARGFDLRFASAALVRHPTRSFARLVAKHFRVGTGQPRLLAQRGVAGAALWRNTLKSVRPPSRTALRRRLDPHPDAGRPGLFAAIWMCEWTCRVARAAGRAWTAARG